LKKLSKTFPPMGSTRRALSEGFWSLNAGSVSCRKLKARRVDNVSNVFRKGGLLEKVAVTDKELKGSSQFGTNERKMRLRKSDEP
jgi:hypothetical protein